LEHFISAGDAMLTYCQYVLAHPEDELNRSYHDTEYGFPIRDDNLLFERFMLEINQAGLSWATILRKADNFRRAFDGFEVARVAAYDQRDIERLLSDAGIIRNRLKINAAIENARRIQQLQAAAGSFRAWLDSHHPGALPEWVKLFKATFVFTGGEIVREFLVSTGYLPGAHDEDCPVHAAVAALQPPWAIIK
jgi:DNA-3-methyladenine glycosylase I